MQRGSLRARFFQPHLEPGFKPFEAERTHLPGLGIKVEDLTRAAQRDFVARSVFTDLLEVPEDGATGAVGERGRVRTFAREGGSTGGNSMFTSFSTH